MGNEERTNIVSTILLESLCGGLPNELFKLDEEENSKEREGEARREISANGNEMRRNEKEIRTNKRRKLCLQKTLYHRFHSVLPASA